MSSLQNVVSLDERTVQKAARGLELVVHPSQRRAESRPRTSSVSVETVHELVMNEAHRIIESSTYSRIELVDATTVIVH